MAKFEIDIPDDVIADFCEARGRNLADGRSVSAFIISELQKFFKGDVVALRADRARAAEKLRVERQQDAAIVVGVVVVVPPVP